MRDECVPLRVGHLVVCKNSSGYPLTEGKSYVVLEYEPPSQWSEHYTAPAYVTVINDHGTHSVCHASRFALR